MTIELVLPYLNTLLLLIIFFYQKNRNKVLIDRITQQEQTLNETKGLIAQQSTAIDSQSKVVETAIKYSESFSVEKLETIIRREVILEQKEEKEILQKDIQEKAKRINQLGDTAGKSVELAQTLLDDVFSPILEVLVFELIRKEKPKREKIISDMKNTKAKEILTNVINNVEMKLQDNL